MTALPLFTPGYRLVDGTQLNGVVTVVNNLSGGGTAGPITGSTLSVSGASTLTGNVAAAGALTVTGAVTGGNITTAGTMATAALTASGNATVTGLVTAGNVTTAGTVTAGTLTGTVKATGGASGTFDLASTGNITVVSGVITKIGA